MEYASAKERLLNAIPEYIIAFILFNVLSAFVVINLSYGKGDMQAAPFVIIIMGIIPISFAVDIIVNPGGYGVDLITYLSIFIAMLVFEAVYFTINDFIAISRFNSGKPVNLVLKRADGGNLNIFKLFIRNILRAISRIFLMLPCLTMFFNEGKQTLYDKATNVIMLSNDG